MATLYKWTAEAVIDRIRLQAAEDMDGVAYRKFAECGLKGQAERFFGSWEEACKAAGVPSKNQKKKTQSKPLYCSVRPTNIDLSDGTEIDVEAGKGLAYNKSGSICWDCIHSGTTKENRCSWDATLKIPKGAVFYMNPGDNFVPAIIYCPLFKEGHISGFGIGKKNKPRKSTV